MGVITVFKQCYFQKFEIGGYRQMFWGGVNMRKAFFLKKL